LELSRSFLRRSCPPHPRAVSASAVLAPPLNPRLRRIIKNPSAVPIGADLDALHITIRQHLAERRRNPRDHPTPITPYRNDLGPKTILVLDELLPSRYVQSTVQFGEFLPAKRSSNGEFPSCAPQHVAQLKQFAARRVVRLSGMQLPMLEKCIDPVRVRKMVLAFPEAIPFLAVDEVHPGSHLAESVLVENVVACH